jgi:hypothetical protein
MAIPMWPLSLPQVPLADGYSETAPSGLAETDIARGPKRRRMTAFRNSGTFTAKYYMTEVQITVLDTFIRDSLYHGVQTLRMPHPRTGAYILANINPTDENSFYTLDKVAPDMYQVSLSFDMVYTPMTEVQLNAGTPYTSPAAVNNVKAVYAESTSPSSGSVYTWTFTVAKDYASIQLPPSVTWASKPSVFMVGNTYTMRITTGDYQDTGTFTVTAS